MKTSLHFLGYTLVGYLVVAIICQFLPTNRPDFAQVFIPNSRFGNAIQGNEEIILGYANGRVQIQGNVKPHAAGPAEHVHTGFDEPFSVSSGTLSLLVDGKIKRLRAGESFTVPHGTYHKFFNETDSIATATGDAPAEFVFVLTQLYGLMNTDPSIFSSLRFLLQLAVWGNDFDSYLKEGPPPIVVKTLKFLALPIAKIAGYQYANPAYYPKPSPPITVAVPSESAN
ncbi:cupin domain-containing protein [Spirosoma aerolatum]|uniref:cupin domain-containing protein n=1 Tax=Spirosoma aerolatum TaxID=1211326 RepID=UPI0009ACF1E9|nr:cupin domain-containing protein [Spirosoma aerolatum]